MEPTYLNIGPPLSRALVPIKTIEPISVTDSSKSFLSAKWKRYALAFGLGVIGFLGLKYYHRLSSGMPVFEHSAACPASWAIGYWKHDRLELQLHQEGGYGASLEGNLTEEMSELAVVRPLEGVQCNQYCVLFTAKTADAVLIRSNYGGDQYLLVKSSKKDKTASLYKLKGNSGLRYSLHPQKRLGVTEVLPRQPEIHHELVCRFVRQ